MRVVRGEILKVRVVRVRGCRGWRGVERMMRFWDGMGWWEMVLVVERHVSPPLINITSNQILFVYLRGTVPGEGRLTGDAQGERRHRGGTEEEESRRERGRAEGRLLRIVMVGGLNIGIVIQGCCVMRIRLA